MTSTQYTTKEMSGNHVEVLDSSSGTPIFDLHAEKGLVSINGKSNSFNKPVPLECAKQLRSALDRAIGWAEKEVSGSRSSPSH
jgi:hypothetical protein